MMLLTMRSLFGHCRRYAYTIRYYNVRKLYYYGGHEYYYTRTTDPQQQQTGNYHPAVQNIIMCSVLCRCAERTRGPPRKRPRRRNDDRRGHRTI